MTLHCIKRIIRSYTELSVQRDAGKALDIILVTALMGGSSTVNVLKQAGMSAFLSPLWGIT